MPQNQAPSPDSEPVSTLDDLVAHFRRGEKSSGRFRIGVEHEKIGVTSGDFRPVPYADEPGRPQIRALLQELEGLGWQPTAEDGNVIALKRDGASVTLEPGGQFELSGAPFDTAVAAVHDVDQHMAELLPAAERMGILFLGCGFRPLGTWDDVTWMPKGRYRVMREYMPNHGRLGVEMMKRTATVQANLDYSSEADAMEKLRLSMALAPLVTAMFAASPLLDGRPSGYQSYRAACWLDTDPTRCGILPFLFTPEASFAAYAEWALDVPMFFVRRHHVYHPVDGPTGGLTFRRFMREGWQGEHPTREDWDLHLSTLFPDSRLRQYVEMRSADSGPMEMIRALPCLWRGVLYTTEGRAAAWDLVRRFGFAELEELRQIVPRQGLRAQLGGQPIAPLCIELARIAQRGLQALSSTEGIHMLEPLLQGTIEGRSPADRILEAFHESRGDTAAFVDKIRYRL